MRVEINNKADYDRYVKHGFEPLVQWNLFIVNITLRKDIETMLLSGNIERYYRYSYEKRVVKVCENCYHPLPNYSAVYISHILSRGAFKEMALDLRNNNLLCFDCHNKWENGNKKEMVIYHKNKKLIKELKKDYECK